MVLLRNAFPLVLVLGPAPARSLENGVGITPPMGFNPWNCFGISSKGTCKLPLPWLERAGAKQPCHGFNESVIMDVAHAIASSPLKAAGYEYVNLDCGYSTGFRGKDGSLTVNRERYPHGMVWLGQQIAALGLKFGMYSDAGTQQCCSRFYGKGVNDGSKGYEEADAKQFVSWGVMYLKHGEHHPLACSLLRQVSSALWRRFLRGKRLLLPSDARCLEPNGHARVLLYPRAAGCASACQLLAHNRGHQQRLGEHSGASRSQRPPRPRSRTR